MTVLKIICLLLGFAFLGFGYCIRFRRMFDLINGFSAQQKRGMRDEAYALRVGMIEFVVGLGLIAVSILLLLLA